MCAARSKASAASCSGASRSSPAGRWRWASFRRRSSGDGAAFVGLPGNPVAVFVTFVRVVRPLLLRLVRRAAGAAVAMPARAAFSYKKRKGRREYVRVALRAAADGTIEAVKHAQDGAGVLTSLTETDGLAELAEDVTTVEPGSTIGFLSYASLCWSSVGYCAAIVSARAASSGVLTLKNGSTGSAGQSAMAMPWRAVQISILCRSSSTSACRDLRAAHRPQPDDRMTPFARARAGQRRAGRDARFVQARHQIFRQERTIARHADQPFDVRRVRRRPIEPGENAGERPGKIRHAVGDHRQAGIGETRRIAIGVDDDRGCIAG